MFGKMKTLFLLGSLSTGGMILPTYISNVEIAKNKDSSVESVNNNYKDDGGVENFKNVNKVDNNEDLISTNKVSGKEFDRSNDRVDNNQYFNSFYRKSDQTGMILNDIVNCTDKIDLINNYPKGKISLEYLSKGHGWHWNFGIYNTWFGPKRKYSDNVLELDKLFFDWKNKNEVNLKGNMKTNIQTQYIPVDLGSSYGTHWPRQKQNDIHFSIDNNNGWYNNAKEGVFRLPDENIKSFNTFLTSEWEMNYKNFNGSSELNSWKFGDSFYDYNGSYWTPLGETDCEWRTYLIKMAEMRHLFKSAFVNSPQLLLGMIQMKKLSYSDANDTVWNAKTILKNTANWFKFDESFSQLKVIDEAYQIREYINQNIIKYATGIVIDDFRSNWWEKFEGLNIWKEKPNYNFGGVVFKKESVQNYINKLNSCTFENIGELRRSWFSFAETGVASAFEPAEATYDYSEIINGKTTNGHDDVDHSGLAYRFLGKGFGVYQGNFNYPEIRHIPLDLEDLHKLYRLVVNLFKTNNIYCYIQVKTDGKYEYVKYYDEGDDFVDDAKRDKKLFKIWDGEAGKFNQNLINDVGVDFTDRNELEFKIDEIITDSDTDWEETQGFETNKNKYESNELYSSWWSGDNSFEGGHLQHEISLKYRHNAINFDHILLNEWLQYDFVDTLGISISKKMGQLVRLDNYVALGNGNDEKEYFVNDLIANSNRIILNAINKSVFPTVLNSNDFSYKIKWNLFNEVTSGLGVGDLNRVYNFDTEPFFDIDSWNDALWKMGIVSDTKNNKYPLVSPDLDNNYMYVIATTDFWKYSDGTHGDYELVWEDLLKNNIKFVPAINEIMDNFHFLAEIEPKDRNYIDADGNRKWDNKGYFILKLKICNYGENYTNYIDESNFYDISDEGWKKIYNQLNDPIEIFEDGSKNYKKAGLLSLLNAGDDEVKRYWFNPMKLVEEDNFFSYVSYKMNDWQLDMNLLTEDLGVSKLSDSKYRKILEIIRRWISTTGELDRKQKQKFRELLYDYDTQKMWVDIGLEWFILNGVVDVEIENNAILNHNFNFVSYTDLRYNWLFNKFLKMWGIGFNDLFVKKNIVVKDDFVKGSAYKFSNERFNLTTDRFGNGKICENYNNTFSLINSGERNADVVKIKIPVGWLLEMIEKKLVKLPVQVYGEGLGGFDNKKLMNSIYMIENIENRINETKYNRFSNEPIKFDEQKEINILNMLFVSFGPLVVIGVIGLVVFLFTCNKQKTYGKPVKKEKKSSKNE